MKVGDKFYFSRHAEDMYREMTRLSNARGDSIVQGIFEVDKVGRKRYHLVPIWIETEKSQGRRHYRYQEDLVQAINRNNDTVKTFSKYGVRTIPFSYWDRFVEGGDIIQLEETPTWLAAFAKDALSYNDLVEEIFNL